LKAISIDTCQRTQYCISVATNFCRVFWAKVSEGWIDDHQKSLQSYGQRTKSNFEAVVGVSYHEVV
jgi:Zn-dependent alcohol dehydrogenase